MQENLTQEPVRHQLRRQEGGWLLELRLRLADRPGELADVAACAAEHRANIERFAYNRSEDPGLVLMAVFCAQAQGAGKLADALAARGNVDLHAETSEKPASDAVITDLAGLLRLRLTLEDRPGTLARFAAILKEHGANVIHMDYDGAQAPGMATVAMATPSPEQVSSLLEHLRGNGYHYHVEWQGAEAGPIDAIIGLSEVEAFLFKLKAILPRERVSALSEVIRSSDELRQTLLDFRRESGESGESMAASEVFTNILQLAAASVGRTGRNFSLRLTGPLRLTPQVSLYMLTCPTGANAYLLETGQESTMVDTGYGLYYPDVKQWLGAHGLDPSRIRTVLAGHPDADHAGWAAPLQEDFGAVVRMHPHAAAVFREENRAFGSDTPLQALNRAYTVLINRFTDLRAPAGIEPFGPGQGKTLGGFRVLDTVRVADLELLVLESLGGHVPAQVFLFAPDAGALFCGDYLIDLPSLSEREKSTLSLARFLMTSTNSDSRVFGREMTMLQELMRQSRARLEPVGVTARVFPGHGDFYAVADAEWRCA